MSYTFPWKLIKGSQEIVFPRGSRRFMKVSVSKLDTGEVGTDLDGGALFMGDRSVKLHVFNISCNDMTMPPLSDMWVSDEVTFHSPEEMSVPGPIATLRYDPVPGSVYGVDAADRKVGFTASGSRSVNIPGAVAIRFRPIVEAMISDLQFESEHGRANAGWSMTLRELLGTESSGSSGGDSITFAAPGLQSYAMGDTIILDLATSVTTTTGLPIYFAAASGTLPPGMAMTGAGLISGMPSEPGIHVLVVMAASGPVSAVQTIPFYSHEPDLTFDGTALQNYSAGTPFLLNVAALFSSSDYAPGDEPVFSKFSGSLPDGLSLSSAGVISGTPTAYGPHAASIMAQMGSGQYTFQTFAFYAAEPSVVFGPVSAQTHVPGTAFSLNLATSVSVSNSTATPTFSVVSGSLPAGLSLSGAGVISGTPTAAGSFSVVVRASIAGGFTDDQRVAFNAALPTIAATGITLRDYDVGTAYSLNLSPLVSVANTTAAPVFALVSGALPGGMSVSSAGLVSGIPTAYGAFAATFSATLPTGQTTQLTVAFFDQNPDQFPDAVLLGGTAQTWTESAAVGTTTYDARDFTVSGTLTVVEAGWVEYVLVGGGGGGGSVSSTAGGGGGGAGGFRRERIYLPAGTYTVTVGSGGAAGSDGSMTSLSGYLITRQIFGGGRGGTTSQAGNGSAAGSGGGGGGSPTAAGAGGVASDTGFGSSGGAGQASGTAASQLGGGGGGYSGPGMRAVLGRGHGGHGIKVRLWTALGFCGGGGGGSGSTNGGGPGGDFTTGTNYGGGGDGGYQAVSPIAGLPNSGGGGGGAAGGASGSRTGGAGGSGRAIFIVKRRTA